MTYASRTYGPYLHLWALSMCQNRAHRAQRAKPQVRARGECPGTAHRPGRAHTRTAHTASCPAFPVRGSRARCARSLLRFRTD
jgi:hypothetical protein